MALNKKAYAALRHIAESANGPSNRFDQVPLVVDHFQELLARGLIRCNDPKSWKAMGESHFSNLQCWMTPAGYEQLDNYGFWPKFRKAAFGTAGKIATHVAACLLGLVLSRILSRYGF